MKNLILSVLLVIVSHQLKAQNPFNGETWKLYSIKPGNSLNVYPDKPVPHISFSDSTYQMHTGCNSCLGRFKSTVESLDFISGAGCTKKFCSDKTGEIEKLMKELTSGSPRYSVKSDTLVFDHSNGRRYTFLKSGR